MRGSLRSREPRPFRRRVRLAINVPLKPLDGHTESKITVSTRTKEPRFVVMARRLPPPSTAMTLRADPPGGDGRGAHMRRPARVGRALVAITMGVLVGGGAGSGPSPALAEAQQTQAAAPAQSAPATDPVPVPVPVAPAVQLVVTCPPKPNADACEVLTCKSGEWVSTPKTKGSKCGAIGDPCVYGGTCSGTSLSCFNQTTYTCQPQGACWSAACNGSGGCINTPLPVGTSASACTARGPCEVSACNGAGSCGYTPQPAGTVCGYYSEDTTRPNPCGDRCSGSDYRCGP
jgi:hypothetical protein